LVVERIAVEDDDHPPAPGQLEETTFISPNVMGQIQRGRISVDGKLIATKPSISIEPVGSTYDLLVGRNIWPLGRNFTRRIDRVTQVVAEADGTLVVTAESEKGGLGKRWELRVDPAANYLVRSAKVFHGEDADPSYVVDNAGTMVVGERLIAHTARWFEGATARPVSISVTSVS